MKNKAGLIFVSIILMLLSATVGDAMTTLTSRTTRVVVFKDGYCMIIKEVKGTVDSDRKSLITEIPANAVLGSFWVKTEEGKPVNMVVRQQIVPRAGKNETEKQVELSFSPDTPEGDITLSLSYFGPGIRWIPTYRIEMKENKARLLMQAEILNELEDLENVPLDLVVGVPNFRFKDVVSPMSLETRLKNVLQSTAPDLMVQSMSNMMTQRMGDYRGSMESQDSNVAAPDLPDSLSGEKVQDLFIYNVAKLSLRTGERAAVGLVSSTVPILHVYTWDVNLQRSGVENISSTGRGNSPVNLLKNDIWHQIEIENTTGSPLTTGAAMAVEGYLPIAQELLTYTSIGGKSKLPLTVAIDVRGTYTEEEIKREPAATHFDGNSYAKITKKGILRITNSRSDEIAMVIQANFGGNCSEASDNGKVILSDYLSGDWNNIRGNPALNGHSNICWQLRIKAGETRDLTCVYHYFTR